MVMEIDVMKKKKQNKKKMTFAKLKKAFIEAIKELYASFLRIPVKVRYIMGVWGVLLFLLVSLIAFSSTNNKRLNQYYDMEEQMNVAMLDYVTTHSIYATTDKYFKMSLDALVNESSLSTDVVLDDACIGYSIVYYNDEKEAEKETDKYRVQSFIHCKNYTSKQYNDYK